MQLFLYVNLQAVNRISSLVFEPGSLKYRSPLKAVNNTAKNCCSRLYAKERGNKEYVKKKGRLYGWYCKPMGRADEVGEI